MAAKTRFQIHRVSSFRVTWVTSITLGCTWGARAEKRLNNDQNAKLALFGTPAAPAVAKSALPCSRGVQMRMNQCAILIVLACITHGAYAHGSHSHGTPSPPCDPTTDNNNCEGNHCTKPILHFQSPSHNPTRS